MFSRPRDDHTKRYVCAGRRPGHQLTILAQPVDEMVGRRVLELLETPSFRDAVLAQSGPADDGSLGRALAALGSAPSRMQTLDDEFYVNGAIGQRRCRSIRTKPEREVERLHAQVDRESKQRIVLHPDPRRLWAEADFGQRRELVRLVVKRIRVMPARRGARFDPARVRLDIALLDAERLWLSAVLAERHQTVVLGEVDQVDAVEGQERERVVDVETARRNPGVVLGPRPAT